MVGSTAVSSDKCVVMGGSFMVGSTAVSSDKCIVMWVFHGRVNGRLI